MSSMTDLISVSNNGIKVCNFFVNRNLTALNSLFIVSSISISELRREKLKDVSVSPTLFAKS